MKSLKLLCIFSNGEAHNEQASSSRLLIAFGDTINLFASSLIASVHALIAFGNPIRLSAHALIASTRTAM